MIVSTFISTWESIIQQFFPVFTLPTANIFLDLVTGWVLCTSRRTISGILPFADPDCQRAHDAYHRFFPDSSWAMAELWRCLTLLLVRAFWPAGTIHTDLDDTLYHRSGRKVDGAAWWRDAVCSTGTKVVHAWGLNIVVLTLRIYPPWGGEPLGLPINMRLHRKGGQSLIDLAEDMLNEVVRWLPKRRFHCHCDGFYACLVGRDIPNTHITSRMRRDANIYDLLPETRRRKRGRPRKRGKKLLAPQYMASYVRNWKFVETVERGQVRERMVYCRKVIWYKVSDKPVLLVISRDPGGKDSDDFLVTTNLSLSAARVIGGYAGRWSIEDTVKNAKQGIGGQQPQTWRRKGPERAAALSLWLYSVIWLWYIQHRNTHKSALTWRPWYPAKSRPSFRDAISALRRALWTNRIKSMFGKPAVNDKTTRFLIMVLSTAA